MTEENKIKRTVGNLARLLGIPSDDWLLGAADILEQMPVALFVADQAGMIKYANRRACKTFSYEPDDLQGKDVRELLPAPEAERSTPEHPGTMTVKSEELACRKNGSKFPVSLHLRKIGPKDAQLTLIAVEDLTRERELEQMKHDFLAMISHDLRAPLAAVNGSINLLKDGAYGNLPEAALQTLQATDETLRRLVKLVNDLLQLEKLSASSFDLEPAPVRIADFTEPALSILAAEADRKDINFVFRTAHLSDLSVLADRDRIVQVLVNLMSNALRYSPPGSTITISCAREDNFLRLAVSDQGPGIEPEFQTTIFEKYRQIRERGSKKSSGGTGLGLAICKLIVEQHKGKIGVESQAQQGSEFWFTLPIARN